MKMHLTKTIIPVISLSSLLASASVADAAGLVVTNGCTDVSFCTMNELINGGNITVDDKIFENFSITFSQFGSSTPDWNNVIISGIVSPNSPGIHIDGGGEFIVNSGGFINETFVYDISVTDPNRSIIASGLAIDPADYSVGNDGLFDVLEFVYPDSSAGAWLGFNEIQADGFLGTSTVSDSFILAPASSLYIETNLYLDTFGFGNTVAINGFDQRFVQTVVPVPAALWLFMSGLGFMGGLKRFLG